MENTKKYYIDTTATIISAEAKAALRNAGCTYRVRPDGIMVIVCPEGVNGAYIVEVRNG